MKIIFVNAARIIVLSQLIIIFHLETVLLNCFNEHLRGCRVSIREQKKNGSFLVEQKQALAAWRMLLSVLSDFCSRH